MVLLILIIVRFNAIWNFSFAFFQFHKQVGIIELNDMVAMHHGDISWSSDIRIEFLFQIIF